MSALDALLPELWPRIFWHVCDGMFAMDHLNHADLEDLPPPVFPATFCGGLVTRLDAVATRPLAEILVYNPWRREMIVDASDKQRVRQRERDVWSAFEREAEALAIEDARPYGPNYAFLAACAMARRLRVAVRPLLALRATSRGWCERLPWRCIFYQLWDYAERGSLLLPGQTRIRRASTLGNAYASIADDRHLAPDYFFLALHQLLLADAPPGLRRALYAHVVRAREAEQAAREPRRSKRQRVVY